MAFTAETKWLAPQKQLILSWAGKRRVQAEWVLRLKGTRGGNVLMRCGSNLRARTRAMLQGHAQPLFTSTDIVLRVGSIFQARRLSTKC